MVRSGGVLFYKHRKCNECGCEKYCRYTSCKKWCKEEKRMVYCGTMRVIRYGDEK